MVTSTRRGINERCNRRTNVHIQVSNVEGFDAMRRMAISGLVALAILGTISCGSKPLGQAPPAPSADTAISSAAASTVTATSSKSSTPSSTRTPTPTPTPTPKPVTFVFDCYLTDAPKTTRFMDYHEIWALTQPPRLCVDPINVGGTEYTDLQKQAWLAAQGGDTTRAADKKYLYVMYSQCAETDPTRYPMKQFATPSPTGSVGQAREVQGMLLLCPDHPYSAQIRAGAETVMNNDLASSAAVASRQAKIADGGYATPGKHLVGKDVQPGTWRSVGEKVEDCYWEVSDAQGEIMDNNFISVAPQFTIQIPSDAAGFTNTGCTFERID